MLDSALGADLGVANWAAREPSRPALILGDRVRTYGELDARANRLARALRRAGVGLGDRVAVALTNSIEWFEALHAIGRVGALLVPVSYRAKGPEIAYMLEDSRAKLLIAESGLATEIDRALAASRLADAALWVVGEASAAWRGDSFETKIAEVTSSEPLADGFPGGGYDVMIYTSGTTGRPKGIVRDEVLPARRPLQLLGTARLWSYAPTDVHLVTGPLYHTAAGSQGQAHLLVGATVVIQPRFDARACLAAIERHRVTTLQMVPAMFFRLLALPEHERRRHDLSSVRLVLHAAAPCPVAVKRGIIELFPPGTVWEFYGASEGGATRISPEEWLERPGSVGKPWPGLAVEIHNDAGTVLGPGEVGTIWISLPPGGRFSYAGAEEKTRDSVRGGWFTVGDMGSLDADGYLYIADRQIDMIISGGANVYPAEVEELLYRHPAVLDCAVIGVPDDEMGEAVKAIIELRPGARPDEAAVIEFCRRDLAHWKCPRSVEFVSELPREPQGKVRKRELRERYWAGRERKV